jgi:hypothetical protein
MDSDAHTEDPTAALLPHLEPGEVVAVAARAIEGILAVTDRRVLVKISNRVALAAPFHGLRRIQFDIEQRRPATMVIVPQDPALEAQVLSIPPSEIQPAAEAIRTVGHRFAELR